MSVFSLIIIIKKNYYNYYKITRISLVTLIFHFFESKFSFFKIHNILIFLTPKYKFNLDSTQIGFFLDPNQRSKQDIRHLNMDSRSMKQKVFLKEMSKKRELSGHFRQPKETA